MNTGHLMILITNRTKNKLASIKIFSVNDSVAIVISLFICAALCTGHLPGSGKSNCK